MDRPMEEEKVRANGVSPELEGLMDRFLRESDLQDQVRNLIDTPEGQRSRIQINLDQARDFDRRLGAFIQ